MSTGETIAEEVTELLDINREDPAWCSGYVNRAVEVGTITPEQGRSLWNKVFDGKQPAPAQKAPVASSIVEADFAGSPRGGVVGWVVLGSLAFLLLLACLLLAAGPHLIALVR